MKLKQLVWAVGFAASVAAAPAAAQDSIWEVGLLYHFLKTDSDRVATDDGVGFSLDTVWLPDGGNDGVSVHLSQTDLDSEAPGFDFNRFSATLGYWLYFTRPSSDLLRPYFNGGIGYAKHDITDGPGDGEDGLSADLALGVVTNQYLFVPGLRARAEVRPNYDYVLDGVVDYKVSMGLHFVFGGAAAPTYAAPAPIAPAPQPRREAARPAPADPRRIEGRETVYFRTNSAELDAAAQAALKRAADQVKTGKVQELDVVGYTDTTGSVEYNKKLSERRAQTVADFLKAQGLSSGNVNIVGEGVANPVGDNSTKAGRARNRRVEVRLMVLEK